MQILGPSPYAELVQLEVARGRHVFDRLVDNVESLATSTAHGLDDAVAFINRATRAEFWLDLGPLEHPNCALSWQIPGWRPGHSP